jgi:hypothetical protein
MAAKQGVGLVEAYAKAYTDMREKIRDTIHVWRTIAAGFQSALQPVKAGLDDVQMKFKGIQDGVREVAGKCKEEITSAFTSCNAGVRRAYDNCRRDVPSPLRSTCNILKPGHAACAVVRTEICDSLDVGSLVVGNFGILFKLLESLQGMFDISVKLKDDITSKLNSSRTGSEILEDIQNEFDLELDLVKNILSGIQYALILTILLIPLKAFLFLRKELKRGTQRTNGRKGKILGDHEDAGIRKTKKRRTLPCCANKNKKKLTKAARRERKELRLQLILLLTHFLLSLSIISFDQTLYWITSTVRKHGNSTFEASGEIKVNLEVEGGAVLKPLMQAFLNSFNVERNYSFVTSTEECLPNSREPSGLTSLIPIFLIYLLAVVLIVMGNKILGKRSLIVSYFYPNQASLSP